MEKRWYAIQTYVGYEERVKAALEQKVRNKGKGDAFGEVMVPKEKVIDRVRGKRQTVDQRLFPGYIFAQIALDEEIWHLVHSVPKLVGFVGEPDAPVEVAEEEIKKILERIEAGKLSPRPKAIFSVGERVKVTDGPFRDFSGTVQEVRPERSRLRLSISVFGRPTPVELDFVQVEAA